MPALLADTWDNHDLCDRLVAHGVLTPEDSVAGFKREGNPVQVITTSLIPHGVDADGFVDQMGGVHVHEAGLSDAQIAALFTDHLVDQGVHRDFAYNGQARYIREIRRTHNLRTNAGRDQSQRAQILGDANGTGLHGLVGISAGNATIAGTTLTDTGNPFPTATSAAGNSGLQGHVVYVLPQANSGTPAMGVIANNTAGALKVDQWYALPIALTAGIPNAATPTSPCNWVIGPQVGPFNWIGLSTRATTAATDVLRSADSLYGDGSAGGAATELTTNGLARQFVFAVMSAAATTTLTNTWTYTGSGAVTINSVVLCNSGTGGGAASGGGLMYLATAISAATVTNNGDTASVNPWTQNW